MNQVILKQSHEDLFLKIGYVFALNFKEGWFVGRVTGSAWANLQPWSLGNVTAGANLATYDEIQDAQSRHYLEPPKTMKYIMYHTFWGVTPAPARVKVQFPTRNPLGSMLEIIRSDTDNVGYIDGYKSPFWGPFSLNTELFTVNERYPAVNPYNPTADAMANVMMNFDQRQYSYEIIKDEALIKSILLGNTAKKYTMGTVDPVPMTLPAWLHDLIGDKTLNYTNQVMSGMV